MFTWDNVKINRAKKLLWNSIMDFYQVYNHVRLLFFRRRWGGGQKKFLEPRYPCCCFWNSHKQFFKTAKRKYLQNFSKVFKNWIKYSLTICLYSTYIVLNVKLEMSSANKNVQKIGHRIKIEARTSNNQLFECRLIYNLN